MPDRCAQAEEVGKGVGRGQVLQRAVQEAEEQDCKPRRRGV